ncbi:hypothetical protein COV53_06820 [Candidatus Gottesmanbacteria bacterium CG11_big_fil_rev_8_21_14_0_20_37_11]|uniref:Uncharacterized protein n=2 Tax=Candidatus Gottesmaniibacteriota TaxID=1752720 RepID=A0A1J4TNJ9_9BACT|nr:MAG: hypothetical protein AUJ73_04020 [Candidatus Gottesmanbacteria bacterium CG1_02_37_22]PIR07722.1 MAG: hypothetical protein COV53_06820 [Candidatus Gottesmanbacteria bacterium CG11_big_fil_rev_8_21_14_0_20_37_11]PJC80497.1 MAG: hypothetical protein CO008_01740 [Candidatus Roizmanbacteria bacterium CG_4_8_14_3_um_filter_36_12]
MRNVIVKGIILVFLFTTGFHLIKLASDLFLSGWSGSQKELLFLFLYSAVFWIPGLGLVIIGLKILFPNINISFFKPRLKKCRICTKTTQDILVVEGNQYFYYCRNHLINEFAKKFTSFPYKMVVFHPEQERKYCCTMYPYFPLEEMKVFHFDKESVEQMRKTINSIQEICSHCNNKMAQVAYYRKGILHWENSGPKLSEVISKPQYLCVNCTFSNIEQALRSNKDYYSDNGLLAPYKGNGVFVNTFL